MNCWFYSDPHFGHANIIKFTDDKGEQIRKFETIEQHDELLIARFNERVQPSDKVYFMGDVAFKLDVFHRVMPRLNGKKRLVLGNHDTFRMAEYIKFFDKIQESWQPVRSILFTHRPTHMGDHHTKVKMNVHGHVHSNTIDDLRYMNVSVDATDYYPVHWDQIVEEFNKRFPGEIV